MRKGDREGKLQFFKPGNESSPLLKIVFCALSASSKFLYSNLIGVGVVGADQHCLSSWEVKHEINKAFLLCHC